MKLNKFIDSTLLKTNASKEDIDKLIDQANKYDFKTICINPSWVAYAKANLIKSVGVTTVIGFPLGAMTTNAKVFELKEVIDLGADEVDFVINVGWVKSKMFEDVKKEFEALRNAAPNNVLKVILETCLLTNQEIIALSNLAVETKIDFVKTSTGFSTAGATINNIELIKYVVKNNAKIKAAGGIKNQLDALKMIEAGADRLGTSSGMEIVDNKSTADSILY